MGGAGLDTDPPACQWPFTQDVYVEIAGIPTPFLTVSGAGQGIELHLDVKTVSFGPVVHGTFGTKRILLFNTGDVGVRFQVRLRLP